MRFKGALNIILRFCIHGASVDWSSQRADDVYKYNQGLNTSLAAGSVYTYHYIINLYKLQKHPRWHV